MKFFSVFLLFLSLFARSQTPYQLTQVDWRGYHDYYEGRNGIRFQDKIYSSQIIGMGEKLTVFDAESEKLLNELSGARLIIESEKKPLRIDFYGYYVIGNELFLLIRSTGDKGTKNLWKVRAVEGPDFFDSKSAKLLLSEPNLGAILDRDLREKRVGNKVALYSCGTNKKGKLNDNYTKLMIYDLEQEKVLWQANENRTVSSSFFWKKRFFMTDESIAYSFDGIAYVENFETGEKTELNLGELLKDDENSRWLRIINFRKTDSGEYVVFVEKRYDFYLKGWVHRLVFSEDLKLMEDRTVSWNIEEEEDGLEETTADPYICSNGDVFIVSDNEAIFGMDVFGITIDGKKWMKSIPFNHGKARSYIPHDFSGIALQVRLFNDALYIAYTDNRQNLKEFDYNSYKRPKKDLDTYLYTDPPKNMVITILQIESSGKVQILRVVDHANSDIHLTNMSVEEGKIKLHGAQGYKAKTAVVEY